MSAYLLGLMKEDAARRIASRPTRATLTAILAAAKSSMRRGELSKTELAQLGGYVIGTALSFHVIGETQALAGLQALRQVVARVKTKKQTGKKKRSKKRSKKTLGDKLRSLSPPRRRGWGR